MIDRCFTPYFSFGNTPSLCIQVPRQLAASTINSTLAESTEDLEYRLLGSHYFTAKVKYGYLITY